MSAQFGISLFAVIFQSQAEKWRYLARSHVRAVIVVLHQFIMTLLEANFSDGRVRKELWDLVLYDRVMEAYRQALKQAEMLVDLELNGRPSTHNHYFNDNLQKARLQRHKKSIRDVSSPSNSKGSHPDHVSVSLLAFDQLVEAKSNSEQSSRTCMTISRAITK